MPKADVLSHIPFVGRLSDIVGAKRRWGVSTAALAYGLYKLGLVSDWQYRTFCIQINQNGYRSDEPNGLPRRIRNLERGVHGALGRSDIEEPCCRSTSPAAGRVRKLGLGLTSDVAPPERAKGRPSLKSV
jgi:hypothetical protein